MKFMDVLISAKKPKRQQAPFFPLHLDRKGALLWKRMHYYCALPLLNEL